MENKGLYYLAHPYTADTPEKIEANVQSADRIAAKLISLGFFVYSPISHTHRMHLAGVKLGFWPVSEWQLWMDLDATFIDTCTGIILPPGWEQSEGCRIEHDHFKENNKEILFLGDLINEDSN